MLPVDVTRSEWQCTVESGASGAAPCAAQHLRLGLRYAKGLREEAGRAIVRARPFTSVDDLALRVPELRKDEINRLAEIGALNSLDRSIAATRCGRRSAPFCRWARCWSRWKKRARLRRWRPCIPKSGCGPITAAPV